MIRNVIVASRPDFVIEQVIDRDSYTVSIVTPAGAISLDPADARLLAVDLLSGALEPDTCPGTYDEGGCGNYVPCDHHGGA